jgi:hypothetical protein
MKCLKSIKVLALGALIAAATTTMSEPKQLCDGFLPPNNMKIPVGDKSIKGFTGGNGITEAQFNEIMDRIQAQLGDVVKAKGGTLVINRLWDDATVNASAQQQGNQWIINMYGGLARHPDINYEGMALVACHEMGHHLGGAPKINQVFGGAWATNEGGADYFATLKCLRGFFGNDDNGAIVAKANIDPLAKSGCMQQFKTTAEQDLCMRTSIAGDSVAYVFMDLRKETTKPRIDTPDKTEVDQMDDNHPATQCRMDTYYAGIFCPVAASMPNSDTDYKAGSCVQGVDPIGYRPRCWFQPNSANGGGGGGGGGGGNGTCPFGDKSICDQICQIDPSQDFCKK